VGTGCGASASRAATPCGASASRAATPCDAYNLASDPCGLIVGSTQLRRCIRTCRRVKMTCSKRVCDF